MATQKQIRFLYQAKNNATGLTDVKAQIYVNGVAKAVGVSAIVATEVDATNAPGVYEVTLSAANLTTWGVTPGFYAAVEARINSVTQSAPAVFRTEATVANLDDIDTKLGTPAGASIAADIASIAAAVASIQNNAGFAIPVPKQLTIPASSSNAYRIPITVYNEHNQLVDADANSVIVGLVNQAGTDRGSNLTGSAGGPATVTATRDSVGQYHVDLTVQSTAVEEEWIFSFAYAIGGAATSRRAVSQTILAVNADGLALQATLVDVQGDVDAIEASVNDGTSGLVAAHTLQVAIQTAVAAVQTDLITNVEGTGFDNTVDSLRQQGLYMRANLYQGGRAV